VPLCGTIFGGFKNQVQHRVNESHQLAILVEPCARYKPRAAFSSLAVKSGLVIDPFDEQLWALFLPFLERQDRRLAVDGTLRNVMVVQLQIVQQARLQVGPAVETRLLQQFTDTAIETLYHAIRLRVPQRCEAMLGRQCRAGHIECMLAARLLVLGRKSVCKLRAVIGQDLRRLGLPGSRSGCTGCRYHPDPKRSPTLAR
jgi:hypothetical protein